MNRLVATSMLLLAAVGFVVDLTYFRQACAFVFVVKVVVTEYTFLGRAFLLQTDLSETSTPRVFRSPFGSRWDFQKAYGLDDTSEDKEGGDNILKEMLPSAGHAEPAQKSSQLTLDHCLTKVGGRR